MSAIAARLETQPCQLVLFRERVALLDEARPQLDADDFRAVAQQLRDGEREVTLAAAHIDDAQRLLRLSFDSGLREQVADELGEFLDLAKFVRHLRARLAVRVGHAEVAQPRAIRRDQVLFGAVVRGGGRGRRRPCGGVDREAVAALRLALQLRRLLGGEQVGVEKRLADEPAEFFQRLCRRQVLREVARRVAPHEAQVRAGFERDGPHEQIAQRGVVAPVFPERELGQRAVVDRGSQQLEEAVARGSGVGHGGPRWRLRRGPQSRLCARKSPAWSAPGFKSRSGYLPCLARMASISSMTRFMRATSAR